MTRDPFDLARQTRRDCARQYAYFRRVLAHNKNTWNIGDLFQTWRNLELVKATWKEQHPLFTK